MKRARLMSLPTAELLGMELDMSTNLTFATGGIPQGIRFVLVNSRVPRADERCTLCGGFIKKGYVRDSQTRLIYCDKCFAGARSWRPRGMIGDARDGVCV
jgi:hypothetical protein